MTDIGGISRRNFFKLALAGATVAATTASPAIATLLHDEYAEKIKQVIRLHTAVVEDSEASKKRMAGKSFEDLCEFLVDNFKCPERDDPDFLAAQVVIQSIFKGDEAGNQWREVPPTIPEAAVVVAVIRDIVVKRNIRFDPLHTHFFAMFAERYQYLILV